MVGDNTGINTYSDVIFLSSLCCCLFYSVFILLFYHLVRNNCTSTSA